MIWIDKPKKGPVLKYVEKARAEECKLINATTTIREKYEENSTKYAEEGLPSTLFRKELYDHEDIKAVLKRSIQHSKCCYCEQYIRDNESLEHYRPKDGYQQERKNKVKKPGYYWLAHVWSNLFYACGKCNSTKGAYFPLDDDKQRTTSHLHDHECKNESPLIIHPTDENPRLFIEFFWLEPFGKGASSYRGELTIGAVGLRRTGLFEARIEHWDKIMAYRDAIMLKIRRDPTKRDELLSEFDNYLLQKISAKSQFSAMVDDNLTEFTLN